MGRGGDRRVGLYPFLGGDPDHRRLLGGHIQLLGGYRGGGRFSGVPEEELQEHTECPLAVLVGEEVLEPGGGEGAAQEAVGNLQDVSHPFLTRLFHVLPLGVPRLGHLGIILDFENGGTLELRGVFGDHEPDQEGQFLAEGLEHAFERVDHMLPDGFQVRVFGLGPGGGGVGVRVLGGPVDGQSPRGLG